MIINSLSKIVRDGGLLTPLDVIAIPILLQQTSSCSKTNKETDFEFEVCQHGAPLDERGR